MSVLSKQVFETTDGKQFTDVAAAEAHQFALDNEVLVNEIAESYVNIAVAPGAKEAGMVGRTRAFNANVARGVVSFLLSKGVEINDFEAILPSEELQARLDAEAQKEAEKAAAKKAKEGEAETEDETADAKDDEDLFGDNE